MNQADFNTLSEQLLDLPHIQKKQLLSLLSELIDSQAEACIENSADVSTCRHCGRGNVRKWGSSHGLQRYKCNHEACGKTFNALTNTPLSGLRHKEKWLDYLLCMLDSITLRQAAARVNIDLTTSFRWRHRFLQAPTAQRAEQVTGIVEADETFFVESHKGKRQITQRSPRKRGGEGKKNQSDDQVSVLIVKDRSGHLYDYVLDELNKEQIHQHLKPLINSEAVLCTDGASWYKSFAKQEQITHHRLIALDNKRVIGKVFHIQNVNGYISRLKTWMKRFHGVGTQYLANYLGWMRLFETAQCSTCHWLKLALFPYHQQLTRT